MKGTLKTRMCVAAVVVAVAMAAGSLSANHSWGNYHWARTSNPFTLAAGDNVSNAWDSYLDTTIADWSASTVLNVVKVSGGTRPRQCKATTGRIEVCNDAYGLNGWLGVARISVNGSHITAATTKVNDSYFNTSTYNTPAWRNLVMCQEVGHDFGLAHQDENFDNANLGSCMDYTNNPGTNQHPNSHDYQQLETIYSHLDTFSTVGTFSAAAMPQEKHNEPENWGQLVRSSRNGRVQVYDLDLGGGRRVVTHVFWADPEGDARH